MRNDVEIRWIVAGVVGGLAASALYPLLLLVDLSAAVTDDLVIVPVLVITALRLVPEEVIAECRAQSPGRGTET